MTRDASTTPLKIAGTAPVLLAEDVAHTVAYYCVILGFAVEFTQSERYIGVYRDGVHLHLASSSGAPLHSNRVAWTETFHPADVNFFVSDVDALYAEFKKKGATIDGPPQDQSYGVRDFQVTDCNGYLLRFNQIL
jgi:predicted enzyme related to lactoylglutathione lyase